MVSPYLHYELLGPRADLDAWLGTLQDAGTCHLADALHGLEGEAGVGRPDLRPEEVHAGLVRSEAARALRGVARVLPPTPRRREIERRPDWVLGPGGVGERDLRVLQQEACDIAGDLRADLERVRACEEEVERLDAVHAARHVLERNRAPDEDATVFWLPRASRRVRTLQRRLARLGATCWRGDGETVRVVVVPGAAPPPTAGEAAASLGAPSARLPDAATASRVEVAASLASARRAEAEARAVLRTRVGEVGARGRFLLDSIEDAEARTGARRLLASTDHVAAARVYVRPEDQSALRECLRAAHGDVVVLRPLAEADDAPSLPRRVAAAPFAAFRGLLPERFGDVAPSSLLALVAPLAVGVIWADVMGGLLLLLAGGLLGWRAGPGSPRRDTALLAQIGGFLALVLGMLEGRAAGALGASWLGTGWGLAPGLLDVLPRASSPWLTPFVQVLFVLGGCALVVALWGGLLALRAWQARRPARAAAILQGALGHALVAGLAAAAAGPAHPAGRLGLLAPLAALVLLLLAGPRRFVVRVALDLVGVLRLVAVAGAALVVFDLVLAGWVAPGPLDLTLGPLALLVAALAVVADPAHLAMGVPYDLSLGGHRLRRPFEVFGRRVRSGGEV